MKTIITILLLLASTGAMAQQQTIYDPNGRVTGRQLPSKGSKTIYDASGSVTGRTSTDSQGTTTI